MHSCLCSFLFSLSLCPPVCCQLRLYTADFLFSSSRSASLYNAILLCSPLPGSLLCSCIWIERLLVSCHFLPLLISPPAYFVSVMATSLYFAHYLYCICCKKKKKSLFTAFHLSVDRNISIFCWSSFKLFWPHFLFLCLSLSVCVAQPDPASHSSCMDHKPQQRNKLRLQGRRGEREHQLQVLDLALYLHLHHPWRWFTVHYGWGTKWQQSRNTYFNSHRWCSNDLLAGGVERWVLCDEIQESECVSETAGPQSHCAFNHLLISTAWQSSVYFEKPCLWK